MTTVAPRPRSKPRAIHIIREVVAEFERPVFLYSIGKDSSVMLHLALKAFAPAPPPFPFLHIATGWDFRAMLDHRDAVAARYIASTCASITTPKPPPRAGSTRSTTPTPDYTRAMLTEALKAALDAGGYDAAFGGGRRDEERARAKERIFSFRSAAHVWDPKLQRPELWRLYNGQASGKRRERPRVPAVELDRDSTSGNYIARGEASRSCPLYFAADRVRRWSATARS